MFKQRSLIKKIVLESCCHPTAEMIYQMAKKEMPTIALGTVYRNLNLMVRDGEIRRICIPDEPCRFDKTIAPHGHMVCTECGKVIDLPTNELERNIYECTGADVLSYEFTAQVICTDCLRMRCTDPGHIREIKNQN